MAPRTRKAKASPASDSANVSDYRYPDTRKNNPPAGLASQGKLAEVPKQRYSYDPHLPPVLRFDSTGREDRIPALLETARQRPLTAEEAQLLADALRNRQPWLEWAGKREARSFDVDAVALHIHERVSAQAVLRIAARQNVQRSLWGDPELDYQEAVQFYRHNVAWTNRMILGDSLVVMNSLAKREDLAGKVQMIYLDPPYGIRFASNFQPTIGNRDVKDREQDLTREPEMVKAYRDTWTLGVHSYLAYLRDRLIVAKELLSDSGSVFVQIGEENLHRVKMVMDEVFGGENRCGEIVFRTTGGQSSSLIAPTTDSLLWYAKRKEEAAAKFHQPRIEKMGGADEASGQYTWIEPSNYAFEARRMTEDDIPIEGLRMLRPDNLYGQGAPSDPSEYSFEWRGRIFSCPQNNHWKTSVKNGGMRRLAQADRLLLLGNTVSYKRYVDDFALYNVDNVWNDTAISGFARKKQFVCETSTKVIERCLLMTTDPGDLVLDPTCGSGTTAYVAEQWGRRWITIDTSRVAIALARQRLLTARFDHYKTRDGSNQLHAKSFVYKTVPHIMLKSIAQNVALDPIFARWGTALKEKLEYLNLALAEVPASVRSALQAKLAAKERTEGKRAVTEADRRRWLLPKEGWQEWEVPYDTDPDWPDDLREALEDYRKAWRNKMDEVNACIAANAESEELVDQPEKVNGVVRVSGPFTVEAVQPLEESLQEGSPIGGEPEALETFEGGQSINLDGPANAEAYLDKMLRLLRKDGVRFPDNKVMQFTSLEALTGSGNWLHAEGEWRASEDANGVRRVAVSIGPQYGPVASVQVEECIPVAARRGYDDLVFAGFSFDGAAQAIIQADPHLRIRLHLAHIRPDVNMGGLLKETPDSQLFTVFGLPRTELTPAADGQYVVKMEGVDVYNPVDNVVQSTGADKVAAWFVDTDYDGRTFCISQAFFPDRSAWQSLARALKGIVDEEAFEAFSGMESLPFPAGKHKRVAVKVIDPRGNEVMRVHSLEEGVSYGAR